MIRFERKCVLGLGVSMGVLLGACSDRSEGRSEDVGEVKSAITRSYTVSFPRWAPLADVVVGGLGGDVSINDRAKLTVPSTIPGVQLTPVVAAQREVKIGSQALVGAVVSVHNVTIRSGGHATSVTTSSFLETQQGGGTSSLEQQADLTPPEVTGLSFSFPDVNQGDRASATRGPVVNLVPNRYGNVTLQSFSSLRLTSGNYRLNSLTIEPDGVLTVDNSAGPVVVLVESSFIYRGKVTLTAPALGNVLFIYEGTSMVSVEAPFLGTLLAPNARINVDSPSHRGRTHQGAFIGFDVIVHQDQVVVHRPFRNVPGPTCDVAAFTEIANFPHDRSRDEDNDIQGVTMSDTRWYFTNAHASDCDLNSCDSAVSRMWSFGLNENIGADVTDLRANPWQGTYNHFGDIAFVKARGGFGDLLYIALEASPGGNGGRPAIGFVSPDLSVHFGFARLGQAPLKEADQTASAPWVAFHRIQDLAYSAPFNSAWLNSYNVRFAADGSIEVPHRRNVRFRDCATNSPATVSRMQGADFSATGKLYISVDVPNGGVIVVDPQSGSILDFARLNFDPVGSKEELEGLVVGNLEGGIGPDGHVHVLMIQNEVVDNDDLYFKHLRADDFSKL
jgi:hypothetical protein